MLRAAIQRLIERAERRVPDFIIGGEADPYMRRWWLVRRNRLANVYLHNMLRDDDDRALHDHPWPNVSIILRGGYTEIVPAFPLHWERGDRRTNAISRRAGEVIVRGARSPHRLALIDGEPCWSLFLTGPRLRAWGFWCEHGWRHWREFTDPATAGATIGRGCD